MKKLLFSCLALAGVFAMGQDTCDAAVALSAGTYTVDAVNGDATPESCDGGDPATMGEWYTVAASVSEFANVTISTNLPDNTGGDTRIQVYSGACGALVCEEASDDVDVTGGNYLSEVSFLIPPGETRYIAFDNRWSAEGFDFSVTIENVTPDCSTSLPFTEEFDSSIDFVCYMTEDLDGNGVSWISQQDLDLDSDGTVETFATNGGGTAGAVDYLISPMITVDADGQLNLVAHFNGYSQEEPSNQNLEAILLDGNTSSANVVGTFFLYEGVENGVFETLETDAIESSGNVDVTAGDYYVAFKATSTGDTGFILFFDYTVSSSLSVNDISSNNITAVYPNPAKDKVEVRLAKDFDANKTTVTLSDVTGKTVATFANVNSVNVHKLPAGVYFMTITDGHKTETKKLIKK